MTGSPLRIVSLVPSLTELLCDLGLRGQLVGRTGFCVHPAHSLRDVPKVGGTKDVDIDKVRALAPTHLVVNVDENEKPTVDALARFVPNLVVTHPIAVTDNLDLYRRFGELFDCRDRAGQLARQLTDALDRAAGLLRARRNVIYLIWKSPWMTVGPETYISKTLATVGLQTLAPQSADRYPVIDWAQFDARQADTVLLSSEPYRFRGAHCAQLMADPQVGARDCRLIDGEMTSWYGSRAIAGIQYLIDYRLQLDRALVSA